MSNQIHKTVYLKIRPNENEKSKKIIKNIRFNSSDKKI